MTHPQALWIEAAGRAARRHATLGDGPLLVRTLFSGISRGTEATIFAGRVPPSEWERMCAPFQEGSFAFPVKYGYSGVGLVEEGPPEWTGRTVFALTPHQDRFRLSPDAVLPVPAGVPPERAVLAANMETALNIVWDAGLAPGDRVAVVGGGTVGILAAWASAGLPGAEVTLVDTNPAREALATRLGFAFARPDAAPSDCDVAIHASATAAGLGTAIEACGFEGRIVEASWHGEGEVPVALGGAFHSRRLTLVSSQVGHVPPARRARWSRRRRLETALGLLADPRLDALISGETDFSDLAERYGEILADPDTLCHRIRYRGRPCSASKSAIT